MSGNFLKDHTAKKKKPEEKKGTISSGGLIQPAWKSGLGLQGRDVLVVENQFEGVLCLTGTFIPFTPTFTAAHIPPNNFISCTNMSQPAIKTGPVSKRCPGSCWKRRAFLVLAADGCHRCCAAASFRVNTVVSLQLKPAQMLIKRTD